MPRTTLIESTKNEVAASDTFTLEPGESRRFYSEPQLLTGDFVTAFVLKGSDYKSLGTLINEGESSGIIRNKKNYSRTFRLKKSSTRQSVKISYD